MTMAVDSVRAADMDVFIARWQASGGAERANYQLFLTGLCDLLDLPQPEPTRPDDRDNAYVFERTVTLQQGDGSATPNYIDLYKRGCFILEAKQGSDKNPPLVFPELAARRKAGTARRGTGGWDRAMQAAKNQAERYAKALPLAEGWPPFLLVVDVGHSIELYSEFSCSGKTYLPFPDVRSHRIFLTDLRDAAVRDRLRQVWSAPHSLDPAQRSARVTREVSDQLARIAKSLEAAGQAARPVGDFLKRCLFTLFAEDVGLIPGGGFTALLESLRGSAATFAPMVESLWQTMKDGGFSPVLRQKLPRFNGGLFEAAEALPLTEDQLEMLIHAARADWRDVEPAIFGTLLERALDPIERHHLGAHYTPRAYVERLVLPTIIEPLRADWDAALTAAVALAARGKDADALAAAGQPVSRWDGRTTKTHPVTGEAVPDDSARVALLRYVNPREADWPQADFVVGNPPFIGNWRMRQALGDGYAEALRATYPAVPDSSEYVMYWWHKAADLARHGRIRRFGFITTNSLPQTFNRRVVQHHLAAKPPLSLTFAIPDHPWVDAADGAAVRIAMTVGQAGDQAGLLQRVTAERPGDGEGVEVELTKRIGKLFADLTIGADVAGAVPLRANKDLSCPGVKLHGSGFIVTPEEAATLGLGRIPGLEAHIREYRNGRDLAQSPRGVMVIDLFGLEADDVRGRFPEVYQWLLERVKPERDHNSRESYREKWWIFGEPRKDFRPALATLSRYVSTVETARHRYFVFLDQSVLPDNKLVNIAGDDAFILGILSSRIHVAWALAAGSRLGVGNDPVYVKTRCFETFPFPDCGDAQKDRIRALAEALDLHRKRQQERHPDLTLTGMYNVLEKLRTGEALTAKEKTIHEQGLVAVLKQLHDELDAAVAAAYGWPVDLTDEELLERLVALNQQRANEEQQGRVRWLRPEYQNPAGAVLAAGAALAEDAPAQAGLADALVGAAPWPKSLAEQVAAVRAALARQVGAVSAARLKAEFKNARENRLEEILQALVALGQARTTEDGRYVC